MQVISSLYQPNITHKDLKECLKELKHNAYIIIKPFLTWQFAVSYLIVYIPITGMWYVWLWLGLKYGISWLSWVSGAWLTILWSPIAPEKALTIPLARWLQKKLFKKFRK